MLQIQLWASSALAVHGPCTNPANLSQIVSRYASGSHKAKGSIQSCQQQSWQLLLHDSRADPCRQIFLASHAAAAGLRHLDTSSWSPTAMTPGVSATRFHPKKTELLKEGSLHPRNLPERKVPSVVRGSRSFDTSAVTWSVVVTCASVGTGGLSQENLENHQVSFVSIGLAKPLTVFALQ